MKVIPLLGNCFSILGYLEKKISKNLPIWVILIKKLVNVT